MGNEAGKKYELLTLFKWKIDNLLSNKNYRNQNSPINPNDANEILNFAIFDAMEYFKIDLETFWKYVELWPLYEQELWYKSKNPTEFYKSWNNQYSLANACANIINQLSLIDLQRIVHFYFSKRGTYIDYGCGTAALSLGLKIKHLIEGDLILLDVPNDTKNFVKYRIAKHQLNNKVIFEDIFNYYENSVCDGLLCIDVLEHIENSSEVFIEKIAPLIKKESYLIMRAPWRGQLTHIDCAADNFYNNGGRKFLSRNFKEVLRFGKNDIACVYKKLHSSDE